jgi:hypothetical protein
MSEKIVFWRLMTIGCCVLMATMGGCGAVINYQDNITMENLVAKGMHVLDARCAVKGDISGAMCAIRAARP